MGASEQGKPPNTLRAKGVKKEEVPQYISHNKKEKSDTHD
jgi:hypothetical protein